MSDPVVKMSLDLQDEMFKWLAGDLRHVVENLFVLKVSMHGGDPDQLLCRRGACFLTEFAGALEAAALSARLLSSQLDLLRAQLVTPAAPSPGPST